MIMEERLRILLCEDDENLGMLLREYLQAKGYAADLFSDGESGYKAFLKGKYDLCVLDVMMPKKDGFTLAQEIRTVNGEVPIIFLTAKSLKEDILEGFKIGADDYITKPFNPLELIARVKAVLRRSPGNEQDHNIAYGNLSVSLETYEVRLNGKRIEMPPKELEVLHFLAAHEGKVFTREQLLEQVWGFDYYGDSRTIDVHIKRIREKLADAKGWEIKTIWSVGYKFEASKDEG